MGPIHISMKGEFLNIAKLLMEKHRRPMNSRELVNLAIESKLFSDKLNGKTPKKTMEAELSRHVRRYKENAVFVRTGPGKFFLRALLEPETIIYDAPPWQPPPPQEKVLVFPSRWLDELNRFQGIRKYGKQLMKKLIASSSCTYMDRIQAENDDEHKQIITYIMVTRHNEILSFKRGKYNRVVDFLRGCHCIGFGGHVSIDDLGIFGYEDLGVSNNVLRELSEELVLPERDRIRLQQKEGLEFIGLLNDDSSAVGRRHFAIIYKYEVAEGINWNNPRPGEESITQLRWLDPASMNFSLWDYEYWSQLCLREYFRKSVRLQPSYRIRHKHALRPPHVLCVLGGIGSGKSEATRVLREEYGYIEINSGKVLASILGIQPVPLTSREDFQYLAWEFINTPTGPRVLAEKIIEQVKELDKPKILIDGIRQKSTLEQLKFLLGDLRVGLLYIHTPPDIAYEFYKSRTSNDCSIHDFLLVREAPVEKDVNDMIGSSDAIMYNWTGRDMYKNTIRQLMKQVNE